MSLAPLNAIAGVIGVDELSFLVIMMAATVAALTVAVLPRGMAPPVVVIELVLGIVIGPQVLGLAESDDFIDFISNLGLGLLFFFAGYEIEFDRIRGRPLGSAPRVGRFRSRSPTPSAASWRRPAS